MTLKRDDYDAEMAPPPESIRMRWLGVLEGLSVDLKVVSVLPRHEIRFRRNIVRWIMREPEAGGARRSLPSGIVVHAWLNDRDERAITMMRTR